MALRPNVRPAYNKRPKPSKGAGAITALRPFRPLRPNLRKGMAVSQVRRVRRGF